MTKETYLKNYDDFMDEISNNSSNYSDEQWKTADGEFKNFDEVLYKKFENELDWKEKMTLSKYNLQYVYYRNKSTANDFFSKYMHKGYEELKEKVKYYRDHKMDEDLEKLKKASKEAGDSALNLFNKAMNESN